VLRDEQELAACLDVLASRPTFVIGIECPLDVLEERESRRDDRGPGMAREQFGHPAYNRRYALKLDTSVLTPAECARKIREFMAQNGAHR
jgi:chloramphenicol 3-O phosphotransferase